MNIKDKIISGTDQDVKFNLNEILKLIANEAGKIHPSGNYDATSTVVRAAALYSAMQLRILIELYDLPAECSAWIARNLFEITLIIEYSILNPENAKCFVLQKGNDEREMLDAIVSLNPPKCNESICLLNNRIHKLDSVIKKYSKTKLKHFSVAQMARDVGMTDEYQAFFKLYSKYVHPSSWLMFSTENERINFEHKSTFMIQAQYYASRILKLCEGYPK